jgi:uncharacterized protein (DUF3820 family)
MSDISIFGKGGGRRAPGFAFGKHKGKSFQEVAELDQGYCDWAMRMDNPSGALKEFVEFLKAKGMKPAAGAAGRPSTGSQSSSVAGAGARAGGDTQFVCELMQNQQFCVRAERIMPDGHPIGERGAFMAPQTWSALGAMKGARMAADRKKWVFPLRDHESVVSELGRLGTVEPIPP